MSALGDITWREPPIGDLVTYCASDVSSLSLIWVASPGRHASSGRWHRLLVPPLSIKSLRVV